MADALAFSDVIGSWPDAVVCLDEGRVVLANERAATMLDYAIADLRELTFEQLLWEEERQGAAWFEPQNVGEGWRRLIALRRRNGQPVDVDVATSLVTSGGRPWVVATLRDVAMLRPVVDTLDDREHLLRQAVSFSQLGVFHHDHASGELYWSPEMRRIVNVTLDEPVTMNLVLQSVHPADAARVGAAIAKAHSPAGNGEYEVETRMVQRGGEIRWTSTRSQTIFEGEGEQRRPVRTLGVVADITERKEVERERERLISILDTTPDVVGIRSVDGTLLYLNRAGREQLGVHPDLPHTFNLGFGHAPWSATLLREVAIPTAIRTGMWRGETGMVRPNGEEVPMSQVIIAHRDEEGGVAFISTIARDLSEFKAIEAQLLQAQKMEAVGRLAGGMAHDFNNVLSVILGVALSCQAELQDRSPLADDLAEIIRAAERAAELTGQMLAFSRKQVLRPRVVDANAAIQNMTSMLARMLGEDVELRFLPVEGLACIKVDPTRFEQVLMNLAINARDAMVEGGVLTFETHNVDLDEAYVSAHIDAQPGPHVVISVTDTGHGMDAQTRSKIFEPFFTTKLPGQGTGLGLSTVFGVVKQSGGNLWVYSEPGRGTTFKLYFPAAIGATPEELPRRTVVELRAPRPATILLVEDEVPLRHVLVKVLEKAGYRVLEAEDPDHGLALALTEGTAIDLLLTDVVMPKMSGRALAERIMKARPDLAVIYMSGYTENTIVHHGVLEEGVHFLPKPVTPGALLRLLAEVLGPEG